MLNAKFTRHVDHMKLRISNKNENKDIENASTLQVNIHLNSEHLAYVNINNSAYIGRSIYFVLRSPHN